MTSILNKNNNIKFLTFKLHNLEVQLPESFVLLNLPWLSKQFGGNGFKKTDTIDDISYYIPKDYYHIAQSIVDLEDIIIPIKNKNKDTLTYPEWKKKLYSQQALYFLKYGPGGTNYPKDIKWKCIRCKTVTVDRNDPNLYYPHEFYEASDKVLCKNCGRHWPNLRNRWDDEGEEHLQNRINVRGIECGCKHEWEKIDVKFHYD